MPRGLSPAEQVRELFRVFREQDLDALSALLHPEVELEGLKGTFRRVDAVRRWATRGPTGERTMGIEVDDVVELGPTEIAVAGV